MSSTWLILLVWSFGCWFLLLALFQLANFTYFNPQKPPINNNYLNNLINIIVRIYFIYNAVHR